MGLLMKIVWGYILLMYGSVFVVAVLNGHDQLARIAFLVPFLAVCFLLYVRTHIPGGRSRLRANREVDDG